MAEENEIPPIEDIINNAEKYFDFPEDTEEDLEIYNPQKFYSYSELLEVGRDFYHSGDYGVAIYYFSLILKIKDFDDFYLNDFCDFKKQNKITNPHILTTDNVLRFTITNLRVDLRKQLGITPLRHRYRTREEDIEFLGLIKEHSPHYHKFQKLKEKFGTDFKPLFDDFGFLDDPDTEMHWIWLVISYDVDFPEIDLN